MDDKKIMMVLIIAVIVYFMYKAYIKSSENRLVESGMQNSYDQYSASLMANANLPEETDWMAYGYTLLNPASMFFGSAI
jgi:hypothetical protein